MPRHLTDKAVNIIIGLIENTDKKLTWPTIVKATENTLGIKYTRQTLAKHDRIKNAYSKKKEERDGHTKPQYYTFNEMSRVLEQLERLKKDNEMLRRQNDALAVQLAKWAYNASARNLTEADLDTPLPPANRT